VTPFLRGAYGDSAGGGQRDHLVVGYSYTYNTPTILSNPARDSLSSSVRILPVSAQHEVYPIAGRERIHHPLFWDEFVGTLTVMPIY